MAKVSILGVKIDRVTKKQTIEKIANFVKSQKPHQIVTINPEFVMTAQKDKEFKEVINRADLAIADGVGIIWASRLVQHSLSERIAGVDLVDEIAKLASQNNWSIYFLGAKEGIAQKAAENLKKKYKNLKIVGFESGSPHDLTIIEKIKKTKPDILLVAFGAPKQDKWIYKFKESLNVPVMMGVGGSFDFIAKKVPRAPKWLQNIGLEWFHRLINEPWRLKRQLDLPKFAFLVIISKLCTLTRR